MAAVTFSKDRFKKTSAFQNSCGLASGANFIVKHLEETPEEKLSVGFINLKNEFAKCYAVDPSLVNHILSQYPNPQDQQILLTPILRLLLKDLIINDKAIRDKFFSEGKYNFKKALEIFLINDGDITKIGTQQIHNFYFPNKIIMEKFLHEYQQYKKTLPPLTTYKENADQVEKFFSQSVYQKLQDDWDLTYSKNYANHIGDPSKAVPLTAIEAGRLFNYLDISFNAYSSTNPKDPTNDNYILDDSLQVNTPIHTIHVVNRGRHWDEISDKADEVKEHKRVFDLSSQLKTALTIKDKILAKNYIEDDVKQKANLHQLKIKVTKPPVTPASTDTPLSTTPSISTPAYDSHKAINTPSIKRTYTINEAKDSITFEEKHHSHTFNDFNYPVSITRTINERNSVRDDSKIKYFEDWFEAAKQLPEDSPRYTGGRTKEEKEEKEKRYKYVKHAKDANGREGTWYIKLPVMIVDKEPENEMGYGNYLSPNLQDYELLKKKVGGAQASAEGLGVSQFYYVVPEKNVAGETKYVLKKRQGLIKQEQKGPNKPNPAKVISEIQSTFLMSVFLRNDVATTTFITDTKHPKYPKDLLDINGNPKLDTNDHPKPKDKTGEFTSLLTLFYNDCEDMAKDNMRALNLPINTSNERFSRAGTASTTFGGTKHLFEPALFQTNKAGNVVYYDEHGEVAYQVAYERKLNWLRDDDGNLILENDYAHFIFNKDNKDKYVVTELKPPIVKEKDKNGYLTGDYVNEETGEVIKKENLYKDKRPLPHIGRKGKHLSKLLPNAGSVTITYLDKFGKTISEKDAEKKYIHGARPRSRYKGLAKSAYVSGMFNDDDLTSTNFMIIRSGEERVTTEAGTRQTYLAKNYPPELIKFLEKDDADFPRDPVTGELKTPEKQIGRVVRIDTAAAFVDFTDKLRLESWKGVPGKVPSPHFGEIPKDIVSGPEGIEALDEIVNTSEDILNEQIDKVWELTGKQFGAQPIYDYLYNWVQCTKEVNEALSKHSTLTDGLINSLKENLPDEDDNKAKDILVDVGKKLMKKNFKALREQYRERSFQLKVDHCIVRDENGNPVLDDSKSPYKLVAIMQEYPDLIANSKFKFHTLLNKTFFDSNLKEAAVKGIENKVVTNLIETMHHVPGISRINTSNHQVTFYKPYKPKKPATAVTTTAATAATSATAKQPAKLTRAKISRIDADKKSFLSISPSIVTTDQDPEKKLSLEPGSFRMNYYTLPDSKNPTAEKSNDSAIFVEYNNPAQKNRYEIITHSLPQTISKENYFGNYLIELAEKNRNLTQADKNILKQIASKIVVDEHQTKAFLLKVKENKSANQAKLESYDIDIDNGIDTDGKSIKNHLLEKFKKACTIGIPTNTPKITIPSAEYINFAYAQIKTLEAERGAGAEVEIIAPTNRQGKPIEIDDYLRIEAFVIVSALLGKTCINHTNFTRDIFMKDPQNKMSTTLTDNARTAIENYFKNQPDLKHMLPPTVPQPAQGPSVHNASP